MRNYWILALVVLFSACDSNYIYEKEVEIPSEQWQYSDTINYEFVIEDTTANYNLYLDVTHTDQFPRQNFYTMIHTTYPSNRRINSRISIDLADKLGQWYGKCSAEECELRVVLQQNTFFKEAGLHQIVFEQYTREEALSGVKALRFSIEKME